MTSLAELTTSLQKDYEPHRVASEHFEHARKNAALLREHEERFECYLGALEALHSPHGAWSEELCHCRAHRTLKTALSAYRQTAEALRRENLSLWSASRLASKLGV